MVASAWMIYYLNFNWNNGKTSKLNKYEIIFTNNIIDGFHSDVIKL